MEKYKEKIENSINSQLEQRGYVTIIDTLVDISVISKVDYEKWRKGQVPYLEKVCKGSLNRLSKILKEIEKNCKKLKLLERKTVYKRYGEGNCYLHFSKSGNEYIEAKYQTHYVKENIK